MVLLLVFMQLTRDLFAIAKFLLSYAADKQTDQQADKQTYSNVLPTSTDRVTKAIIFVYLIQHFLLWCMPKRFNYKFYLVIYSICMLDLYVCREFVLLKLWIRVRGVRWDS